MFGRGGLYPGGLVSRGLFPWKHKIYKYEQCTRHTHVIQSYRVGQIKRGQLTFLLVTSERIYKSK